MSILNRRFVPVAFVATVVVLLPAYVHAYSLSGASDAPTLLLGDTAIVNRTAYWLELPYIGTRVISVARPARGDLVLVQSPDPGIGLIFKRVVGLPGETIGIDENRIVVDGKPLPLKMLPAREFAWVPKSHRMGRNVYDEDGHWVAFTPGAGHHRNLAPIRLGTRQYFLLGDNRDSSRDCREWGPLKEDAIFGRVAFTLPTGPRDKKT